jgi:hypothetical protein
MRVLSSAVIALFALRFGQADELKHKIVRDGSTIERAIIIRTSQDKEVELEGKYLRMLHPFAARFPLEQALLCDKGILYDLWVMETPAGNRNVYFDLGPNKEICGKKSK